MTDRSRSRTPSPASGRAPSAKSGRSRQPGDAVDADLVARMARGDIQAAQELYRRLSPLVYSLASQIAVLDEDAEEILIESFLQAWLQADRYDPARATVTGWVMNIARSRALDQLRAHRRWEKRKEMTAEPSGTFPRHPPRDPEHEAMRSEERTRLHRAIASLAPDQRRAVELAYFAGLSHSEIAESLGQPLGTVKTRLRLAMKKIRSALADVDSVET